VHARVSELKRAAVEHARARELQVPVIQRLSLRIHHLRTRGAEGIA